MISLMIALNAHYDGKGLVPDKPLDLPANQKVRISIEPIDADPPTARPRTGWHALIGIANEGPTNPNPHSPIPLSGALRQ